MAEPAASSSAQEEVSETTPLLETTGQDEPREQQAVADFPAAADKTAAVSGGTWVSFISGILCICFGIVCAILDDVSPPGFHWSWAVRGMIVPLIFFSVIAVFFAAYNLVWMRRVNRTLPVLLNIVVDVIIAYPLLLNLAQNWDSITTDCYNYGTLPDESLRKCRAWGSMVLPVMWLFFVASGVVGFASLFLCITRCILLYQRRGRREESIGARWQFPAGQLTFEFTIKLMRPEARQDRTAVTDTDGTTAV